MVLVLRCADSCVSGVPPNGTTCSEGHKLANSPLDLQAFHRVCSSIIGRDVGINWQGEFSASSGQEKRLKIYSYEYN